jgi:branched-chain amino acid aminotransferase
MTMVWLDGSFLPESKALIPATDRGFMHGRGLFETLRTYDGAPFRLADHVERMKASARRFGFPMPTGDLDAAIRSLCRRNGIADAAARITLSADGRLLVTTRPRRPVPPTWYSEGAKVDIVPWRRDSRALVAGHKVTSYLENILVHDEALKRGYADALFIGLQDEILEGSVSNLFLVLRGKIVTPKLTGILPGVTRKIVMGLAKVQERTVKLGELKKAEEVFLTNALIEILPIGKPGPVTLRISEAYRQLTSPAAGARWAVR